MEIYGPRAAFKYLNIAFNHRLFAAQAQQKIADRKQLVR